MAQNINKDKLVPYERKWAGTNKIRAVLALTHPTAVIIFSLMVWLVAFLALHRLPDLTISIYLILAMAMAQASIGMFNEVFDWKLDKKTKPWRAIPAGYISPCCAAVIASVLFCLAMIFASRLSLLSAFLLFLGTGMGIAYSAIMKPTVFSWLPYVIDYPALPIWVWISIGRFGPHDLTILIVAAPLALAIHLCNQLRDYDEDDAMGINGVVQHLGKAHSISICYALLILTPIPLLISMITLGRGIQILVWTLSAAIHWTLILSHFFRYHKSPSPEGFRDLFRRLQITSPLLLIGWLYR